MRQRYSKSMIFEAFHSAVSNKKQYSPCTPNKQRSAAHTYCIIYNYQSKQRVSERKRRWKDRASLIKAACCLCNDSSSSSLLFFLSSYKRISSFQGVKLFFTVCWIWRLSECFLWYPVVDHITNSLTVSWEFAFMADTGFLPHKMLFLITTNNSNWMWAVSHRLGLVFLLQPHKAPSEIL